MPLLWALSKSFLIHKGNEVCVKRNEIDYDGFFLTKLGGNPNWLRKAVVKSDGR